METKKFNKTIAKEIAQKQIDFTIDCVLGNTDPDYLLTDDISDYEQNFEEDLQERGIKPTSFKVAEIKNQYKKIRDKIIMTLKKFQSP